MSNNIFIPSTITTSNPVPQPPPFKPLPFCSKPSARIFVGNIAPFIGLDDLRSYFGQFGKVIDVYCPRAIMDKTLHILK